MKTISLILIILIYFKPATSHSIFIPNGTAGIGSSTNSNIGIGTNNPVRKLNLSDVTRYDISVLRIQNMFIPSTGQTTQSVSIEACLSNNEGNPRSAGKIVFGKDNDYRDLVDRDSHIKFYTANEVNNNLRMTINSTGNIGIGTSVPSYKFHTKRDIYADGGWLMER